MVGSVGSVRVILLCAIVGLGSAGDVVTVRRGNAINRLIPSGAAVPCCRALRAPSSADASDRIGCAAAQRIPRYLFFRRVCAHDAAWDVGLRPHDVVSLLRAFGVSVWLDQVEVIRPARGVVEHTALIRSPQGAIRSVRVRVTCSVRA
ncbi:bL9 family ribosomal protein [Candidatus Tremblaya princeps]|uniref:Putative 50S ribosomal protein L9 n=1 Tax=Tremblaya princeps TaxID=189385 RepID=A0A1C3K8Y4_TREPR|nr:bL9 family ribosomal protein [Candidatus Tremblaya princeps]SBT62993.1 Putative 50S ribosomal protein L9 [Candidatus Tremblaya princeps]